MIDWEDSIEETEICTKSKYIQIYSQEKESSLSSAYDEIINMIRSDPDSVVPSSTLLSSILSSDQKWEFRAKKWLSDKTLLLGDKKYHFFSKNEFWFI